MSGTTELRFGPFSLMGRHGPLLRGGENVPLQAKTMALLWTLVRHHGEVVPKDVLMDTIWAGTVVGDEALTFQVGALRRALGDDLRKPRYVITVHRVGFRFGVPVEQGPTDQKAPQEPDAIVGRDTELSALSAALAQADGGQRQLVFVAGEAGIGKTRLVDEWLRGLRREASTVRIARGQCGERSEGGEPFLPLLEALTQLGREVADDRSIGQLKKIAPGWLRELPGLLTDEEVALLRRQTAGQASERMLREFSDAIEMLSQEHPVVLVLEDLHWSDTATVNALALLARRRERARLMVVMTLRPLDAILHDHPIRKLQVSLMSRGLAQQLLPRYLEAVESRAYLAAKFGADMSDELAGRIHERSTGHPLFLAQIAEYLATHGLDDRRVSELPPGVRDLLELQLKELPDDEQRMLEVASLGGAEFAAETVAAALKLKVERVEEVCDRLSQQARFVESHGLAIWPNGVTSGRYRFRHVLYEKVLVQRLTAVQTARLQRVMADHVEKAYGTRAGDVAAELAQRFEDAGAPERALPHVTHLTRVAFSRVAIEETLSLAERGLRLAAALPDGQDRRLAEFRLYTLMVAAQRIRFGASHPALLPNLRQMEERLDAGEGDALLLLWALNLLWWFHQIGARCEDAMRYAEMARSIGRRSGNRMLECAALSWMGTSLSMLGRMSASEQAARQALVIADTILAENPAIGVLEPACTAWSALASATWYLGKPEQANHAGARAIEGASQIGNPYNECAIRIGARLSVLMNAREFATIMAEHPALLAQCRKFDQPEVEDWCIRYYLVARSIEMNTAEHLGELHQRVRAQIEGGKLLGATICSLGEAEIYMRLGRIKEARAAMRFTFDLLHTYKTRSIEPELWRIEAALRLCEGSGDPEEALRKAISVAREQDSLSFELRSAIDLARWLDARSRRSEARNILGDTYSRFTEGFEMREIAEARRLLQELGG